MGNTEQTEIVRILSELILKAVPKAQTVSKYGGTLYTIRPDEKEGQFCGVFILKNYVQLVFSQGALLNDPNQQLEGSGKLRRHINILDEKDIDKTNLNKMVKQAAKVSN